MDAPECRASQQRIVGIVPPPPARTDFVDHTLFSAPRWSRALCDAGFAPLRLGLRDPADLVRLWDCRAVLSLGAGVYPELAGALVAAAAARWVRQGGIWVELAGHFFLFGSRGARVTAPGQLALDQFDLAVDTVVDATALRLTASGRAIVGALELPATVLAANAGSNFPLMVFPTLDPWLSLVETDRGDSLLSVSRCGAGYVVRWGAAARRSTRPFLTLALPRLLRHLLRGAGISGASDGEAPAPRMIVDPQLTPQRGGVTLRAAIVNTATVPYAASSLHVAARSAGEVASSTVATGAIAARSARLHEIPLALRPRDLVDVTVALAGPRAAQTQAVAELRQPPGEHAAGLPAPQRPPDFEAFWQRARSDLRREPREEEWIPMPEATTARVITRCVRFRGHGGVRIGGYFSYPARAAAPAPGVLLLPGYKGMDQFPARLATDGFAVLAIDVRGVGLSAGDFTPSGEGILTHGLSSPERHAYRGAVLDCLRALDVLGAQPMVDAARVGVQGISQGGGLALAIAALDGRVRALVAEVPFLCDIVRSAAAVETEPLAELNRWLRTHPGAAATAVATLAYFDAANFAPDVRCATLLVYAPDDEICPAAGIREAIARLRCPLTTWRCGGGHSYPFLLRHRTRVARWLRRALVAGDAHE